MTREQKLEEAEKEITASHKERERWIDYTIDLQRIIEALCDRRGLPEPLSTARHHYNMAKEFLTRAALTAGEEAGGVNVKALEWKRYRNGDAYAVTPFGDVYTAYAGGYWRITKQGKAGKFIRAGFDVASAQAAAQADYENSVLSVIEPTPSPIVDDAMVERAAKRAFIAWWNNRGAGYEQSWLATKEQWIRQQHAAFTVFNAALSGAREGGEQP
ncbi:hypothetical protein [Nitratireductor indicus]|uniref:hypothetical protein n=1 Tax=Nitratireductor indicus TaxID=721133 RepID=UPI0028760F52|nr:hypothetical protein [Nitratireductor indicus]MDS1138617.1 hypothetical protein [Nitratireductor indicus]